MQPCTGGRFGSLCGVRLLLGVAAMLAAVQATAETLDNQTVIALAKAKVGDEALVAKIDTLPCGYDVSINELAKLREAGVSSRVLAAMIRRCASKQDVTIEGAERPRPGVYLQANSSLPSGTVRIEPAYVSTGRAGGNGSLLFPSKSKLSLPGSSASVEATAKQPVFYFYFAPDGARQDGFGREPSDGARDPSGFNLVRLRVASNKRDITVETATMVGSSAAIEADRAIVFEVSEIGPHAYRVEVMGSLEAGQYAFLERLNGGAYRVYDFRIS
jgi:hypothetical protein